MKYFISNHKDKPYHFVFITLVSFLAAGRILWQLQKGFFSSFSSFHNLVQYKQIFLMSALALHSLSNVQHQHCLVLAQLSNQHCLASDCLVLVLLLLKINSAQHQYCTLMFFTGRQHVQSCSSFKCGNFISLFLFSPFYSADPLYGQKYSVFYILNFTARSLTRKKRLKRWQ